jgi:hypothetical protein
MKLITVDPDNEQHCNVLYNLLRERPDEARISSKGPLPTFEEHCYFVASHPYADWSLIEEYMHPVTQSWPQFIGAVSLSQPATKSVAGDELGVDLFSEFRGYGYAKQALLMMMDRHGPRRYLANIGLRNYRSMAMFCDLGFAPCQMTFEMSPTVNGRDRHRDRVVEASVASFEEEAARMARAVKPGLVHPINEERPAASVEEIRAWAENYLRDTAA